MVSLLASHPVVLSPVFAATATLTNLSAFVAVAALLAAEALVVVAVFVPVARVRVAS
tara:strand:- start:217 stop:387 length:171 start_codon:yes stop_codon:yes gene_type:complete